MESQKPNFNSKFYEDAGDLLAGFRKKNPGARFGKKGKDPYSKDPDVLQSQRQDKLVEKIRGMDLLGSGW